MFNDFLGAVVNDQAAVKASVDTMVTNAEGIFDAVVPIVIAAVALGILLTFVKRVKAR